MTLDYFSVLSLAIMQEEIKTRKPVQERGKKTKRKILDAALNLFSTDGYHNTNTVLIAKEANVSTGSFYMYYKDKKGVLLDVFSEYFISISNEFLSDNFLSSINVLPNKLKVKVLIDGVYNAHLSHTSFHQEAISLIYSDKDIYLLNKELESQITGIITLLLEEIKDDLQVKNIKVASTIIYKSIEEVIHTIIFNEPKEVHKKYLDEIEAMIVSYLFYC